MHPPMSRLRWVAPWTVPALARALGMTCEAFADCEDMAAEPVPKKPARRKRKGK